MNRIVNVISEAKSRLPIYFHSMDNCHMQEDVCLHADRHFHQILFVVEGTGRLEYNGETYPLKRGCAFYAEESVVMEYFNTGGLVTAYAAVCGNAATDMTSYFGIGDFLFYQNIDVDAYVSQITSMIYEYRNKCRDSVISAMLYNLYMSFFQQNMDSNAISLDKTVLYIEQNHNKKLTLKKLAQVNGSSVSKLCHDFKARFGCTVFEYIVNYRLDIAHTLLRIDRSATSKEIALGVGFEDVSYFCRAYKNKFGKTPLEDRKL